MIITLNINETIEIKRNMKNDIFIKFYNETKNPKIYTGSKDLSKGLIMLKEK